MPDNIDPKVQGGEPTGSVTETPVTPAQQGVVSKTTPEQPPVDAEVEKLRADYDKKIADYQRDINNIKSTFQRQISQNENVWKQRQQQWQQELENIRLSNMDDEQRKAYETTRNSTRLSELEQQMAELEEAKQNAEAMLNTNNYFLSKGVPADALVTDQGYEALWTSGMDWLEKDRERLILAAQAHPVSPAPTSPTKPVPPEAPPVDTGSGQPATGGPTWDDLRKKYGSDERVYELVEQRRLPPDIIPGYKKSE